MMILKEHSELVYFQSQLIPLFPYDLNRKNELYVRNKELYLKILDIIKASFSDWSIVATKLENLKHEDLNGPLKQRVTHIARIAVTARMFRKEIANKSERYQKTIKQAVQAYLAHRQFNCFLSDPAIRCLPKIVQQKALIFFERYSPITSDEEEFKNITTSELVPSSPHPPRLQVNKISILNASAKHELIGVPLEKQPQEILQKFHEGHNQEMLCEGRRSKLWNWIHVKVQEKGITDPYIGEGKESSPTRQWYQQWYEKSDYRPFSTQFLLLLQELDACCRKAPFKISPKAQISIALEVVASLQIKPCLNTTQDIVRIALKDKEHIDPYLSRCIQIFNVEKIYAEVNSNYEDQEFKVLRLWFDEWYTQDLAHSLKEFSGVFSKEFLQMLCIVVRNLKILAPDRILKPEELIHKCIDLIKFQPYFELKCFIRDALKIIWPKNNIIIFKSSSDNVSLTEESNLESENLNQWFKNFYPECKLKPFTDQFIMLIKMVHSKSLRLQSLTKISQRDLMQRIFDAIERAKGFPKK